MRLGTYYRYELLKNLGLFNKFRQKDKLLDIGGFDGFTLSRLEVSKKILIDPDAKKTFDNIFYLKKDFFEYDFKKQRFDAVLPLDVLEHIPKEKEVEYFSKIYSVLEKGGAAIITTPSKNITIFPNFLRKWIGRKWGHYKCLGYSKQELESLMKSAKIKKYKIHSCNSRSYFNYYLLVRFLKLILPKPSLKKILTNLAKKDAKLDEGVSKGYYLVRIIK